MFGDSFKSYDGLEKTLKSFESRTFTKFWKREARTIEAARKRTDRHLNPSLKYYQLKYACIHGGQSFRPKSKGIRTTSYVSCVHCVLMAELLPYNIIVFIASQY